MTPAMWILGAIALVFWVLAGRARYAERRTISFYAIPTLEKNIAWRVAAVATVAFLLLVLFR